jgi:hypothetical protein
MNVEGLFRRRGRASIAALVMTVACLLLVPAASFAERVDAEGSLTIKIEAESYWWGHEAGGQTNSVGTCAEGASGGKVVTGLDYPGDWIQMEALVSEPMFFRISLRSAEDVGLRAKFAIQFLPLGPGPIPATDTVTTVAGKGVG